MRPILWVVAAVLAIAFSVATFIGTGANLWIRVRGDRVTATVTACTDDTVHTRTGTRHRTTCRGRWRRPGRPASTGTIRGAANVTARVPVFATATEALVTRDDPTGWGVAGLVVGLAGIGAMARAGRLVRRPGASG